MQPLAPDILAALIARHQAGDRRASDRLLVQFEPLIQSRVRHWTRGKLRPADCEDLAQEGRLGFTRALDKFDVTRGVALATYAGAWIDAYVSRSLRRLPLVALTTAEKKLVASAPGRLDHGQATVRGAALERLRMATSLDATLDDDDASGLTRLPSAAPAIDDELGEREAEAVRRQQLRAALACLTSKQLAVVTRRYLVPEPETLETIARGFGCSREWIRQTEVAAFKRLGRILGATTAPRPHAYGRSLAA